MQTKESAAAKRHLGPIKHSYRKFTTLQVYPMTSLYQIIQITGSEKQVPVFILADKDRGPVYTHGSNARSNEQNLPHEGTSSLRPLRQNQHVSRNCLRI